MRAIILPYAFILTKAHRAAASMMAKESIVAWVLPLRCLCLLPTAILTFFGLSDKQHRPLKNSDMGYGNFLNSTW